MQVKIIDFVMNFNLQVDGEFLNVKIRENSGFTETFFHFYEYCDV